MDNRGQIGLEQRWDQADGKMLDGGFGPVFVDSQESTKQREDSWLQSIGSDTRATITECPRVPYTVLTVITTAFIEHSPGTRLCFSEVLFNLHSNPGREVFLFVFTGR